MFEGNVHFRPFFVVKNGHLVVTRLVDLTFMPLIIFAKVRNISLIHQHYVCSSLKEVCNA